MADSGSEGIRSIQVIIIHIELENIAQHGGNLLLACISLAGDRLLNFPGRVFGDAYALGHRSRNSHSLSPAQLKHRLRVLGVEGGFYGHLTGLIDVYYALQALKDVLQLFLMRIELARVNDPHVTK